MTHDFRWPEPEGAAQQKLVTDVKEYGCHILNVAGEDRPDFSYSVGFYVNFGHPEIVVSGLPAQKAMELINLACDRVRQGETFADGTVSAGLTRNLSLAFVTVAPQHYADRLGFACWFYRSLTSFPVVQLVWPDREGRFPWDPAFDPSFNSSQDLLCGVA